jgi:lipid A disaccharide synthetase
MVTPCINDIKHFNVQLMHSVKNVELLKHFKVKEAALTCFGLQGNHHQGADSQYLAKITLLVQCGYIEVVQTLSVLWLHSMTCEACVLCTV